jgi:hypothetical protein
MDAKELVSGLTNDELAQRLKSLKEDIGPITPTTRPLYEKRLLNRLRLEQASSCTIPYSHRLDEETGGSADDAVCKGTTSHNGMANGTSYCTVLTPVETDRPSSCVESSLQLCTTFYGVQLPSEACMPRGCFVFMNKEDAVKLIKEKKGGRFKAFSSHPEAEEFSKMSENSTGAMPSTPTGIPVQAVLAPVRVIPSESSSFRSLKFQELLPLRRAIEMEDVGTIQSLVWSNPRYLIGSGDNPTILHEGSRYNALHICATKNKPISCKLILDTIEDPKLAQLLYPDDSEDTRKKRIDFFTDLYLNTPDKHLGETPLHFACKYGFVEMVAVLISHPGTDKQLKNIEGLTAREVICERVRNAPNDLKQKIIALFDNLYYVRVIGSTDNSCPARVLPPWSPCVRTAAAGDDGISSEPCSPIKNAKENNQAVVHGSPWELPVTVKAFAGPMSSELAERFHNILVSSPGTLPRERRQKYAQIKRGDCMKGLERIGREISKKMNVPWCEYWEFLDCLIDLESPEGLRKLEDHLRHQLKAAMEARTLAEERARRVDMSICQLMDHLNLNSGSSSLLCCSSPSSQPDCETDCGQSNDNEVHTWPPSLAKNTVALQEATVADERRLMDARGDEVTRDLNPTADMNRLIDADIDSDRVHDTPSCASSDSFHTAPDDLDLEYSLVSEWPEDFGSDSVDPVFIYGEKPCKTDVDVFRALETTVICPSDYPLVYRWWNTVLSYPEEIRNRWVTHERLKHGGVSVCPSHLISTSTPTHDNSFNDLDVSGSSPSDDDTTSDDGERRVRLTLCY